MTFLYSSSSGKPELNEWNHQFTWFFPLHRICERRIVSYEEFSTKEKKLTLI